MRFHTRPRIIVRLMVVLAAVFFAVGQPVARAAIPAEPTAGVGAAPQMTLDLRQVSVEDGTMLEYRISYANTGNETASNVVITNRIPDGAQLVPDSISDGGQVTDDDQTIRWEIGKVSTNGEGVVVFRVYLILPYPTPSPEPTPTSTNTPMPTSTPTPTYTPTAMFTPTSTPEPTATITPTPTPTPPLGLPDANPDTYEVDEDTRLIVPPPGVLTNDVIDPRATPRVRLLDNPAHAQDFALNENGGFTYLPEPNYYGSDNFDYKVCIAPGLCSSSQVNITINPVNDPPDAQDDIYTNAYGETLSVAAPGVLANDSDPDGDALSARLETPPSYGVLQFYADGSFEYTPISGFTGWDSFTYRVSDGRRSDVAEARVVTTDTLARRADQQGVFINQGATITWTWDGGAYSAESNMTIWPPSLFLPMIVK